MLGQARKPEDAMQSMLYLYVPDCDVAFKKHSSQAAPPIQRYRPSSTATDMAA